MSTNLTWGGCISRPDAYGVPVLTVITELSDRQRWTRRYRVTVLTVLRHDWVTRRYRVTVLTVLRHDWVTRRYRVTVLTVTHWRE